MSEDDGTPTPPEQPGYPQQPPSPPPGPQFNPQTGFPVGDGGSPPPFPTAPYAPQPYPPAQPGMPQFPTYVLPDHPKATSALVVGIIAVAGTFICGLPALASPVAWFLGAQARKEIRQAPQQWGGESKATAGMVLGIIGTVLLVLVVLVFAIIIAVAVSDPGAFDSDTGV